MEKQSTLVESLIIKYYSIYFMYLRLEVIREYSKSKKIYINKHKIRRGLSSFGEILQYSDENDEEIHFQG